MAYPIVPEAVAEVLRGRGQSKSGKGVEWRAVSSFAIQDFGRGLKRKEVKFGGAVPNWPDGKNSKFFI